MISYDNVHCAVSFFSRMKIANFDFSKKCHQIAEVTKGLSGREISKIAIAWQVRAYENFNETNVKYQNEKKLKQYHAFTLRIFTIDWSSRHKIAK